MKDQSPKPPLALRLRKLRQDRGLSLRAAAAATVEAATEAAGEVSRAYLVQLEQGQSGRPSLPKLVTLATVYGSSVHDLIDACPAAHREALRSELDRWEKAGRDLPDPTRPFLLHQQREALNAEIDAALVKRARDVHIPLEGDRHAREHARRFVLSAALLPFVDQRDGHSLRLFWSARRDYAKMVTHRAAGRTRHEAWHDLVAMFTVWLCGDAAEHTAALELVSWWRIDFRRMRGTCHFGDPADDARLGLDNVPTELAIAVHAHQLAHRLAAHAPRSLGELPPVPPVHEALRPYLADRLVHPGWPWEPPGSRGSVADVVATAHRLWENLPDLRQVAGISDDDLATIAAFAARAVGDVAANSPGQPAPPRRRRR